MRWMKALSLLLCVAVLAAPTPISSGLIAAADPIADYAAREAQAGDLEQFTGGWHGVVLTLLLIGLVVWIVLEIHHHEELHDSTPPPQPYTP